MVNAQTLSFYGPIAIIALACLWGVARIVYLSKRENVAVLSFLSRRKTSAEIGLGLIAILLDSYLLLRPFMPELDRYLLAIPSPYPVIGVILMGLGIGLMILSQIDMGKAWRIGVPETLEDSQSLITGGVYQFSRNPIYVAIMMFLVGAAVTVPGPLTIGCVLATFFLMQQIIKHEEAFMQNAFGKAYQQYCTDVRRWM
jgi:protein-S-isoprenylcysteine O-methyltransferase Ste14